MSILNPFWKECVNVSSAYVNVSGYYLCRRTLLGIIQEEGENNGEEEKKIYDRFLGGKRNPEPLTHQHRSRRPTNQGQPQLQA